MANSYTQLYVQMVFAVKNRHSLILRVSGKTLCLEKINNKKSCVCNPYFRQSP